MLCRREACRANWYIKSTWPNREDDGRIALLQQDAEGVKDQVEVLHQAIGASAAQRRQKPTEESAKLAVEQDNAGTRSRALAKNVYRMMPGIAKEGKRAVSRPRRVEKTPPGARQAEAGRGSQGRAGSQQREALGDGPLEKRESEGPPTLESLSQSQTSLDDNYANAPNVLVRRCETSNAVKLDQRKRGSE